MQTRKLRQIKKPDLRLISDQSPEETEETEAYDAHARERWEAAAEVPPEPEPPEEETRRRSLGLPGFSGIDDASFFFHIRRGEYRMQCVEISEEVSDAGNEMLVFKFLGVQGVANGRMFRLHCTLLPQTLWKLKGTLQAFGVETLPQASEMAKEDFIGMEVIGEVIDDEWEGRIVSKLNEVKAADDDEDVA